jgi:Xaa-Pro aminopeptidase
MTASFNATTPVEVFRMRRLQLAKQLSRPLLLCAGHAPARNYSANTYPFRASSSFLYYGGPPVEHAALLIRPDRAGDSGCTLLRQRPGPDDPLWCGPTPSDRELADFSGLPVQAVNVLDALADSALTNSVAICPPRPDTLAWLAKLGVAQATSDELIPIIDQRLIKDSHELTAMRHAAAVTGEAHRTAMAATRVGGREADVAAAFGAVLARHECRPSFTPGVTVRGEVLHSQGYANTLTAGALLLVDAGAEEPGGYACDVTRTYPVGGSFTPIQRQLYDVVLRALRAATAACVSGARYRDVHDLAARVICEGLIETGLLRGDPAELVARRAHVLFFPHGVGHLIGLDVHDMEDFGDLAGYAPGRTRRPGFGDKFLRLDRDLVAGMTVTIEPGIYLVPAIWERGDLVGPLADVVNRRAVDALLKSALGGIRIEDTICVRQTGGPEVLTADIPAEADALLACVGR